VTALRSNRRSAQATSVNAGHRLPGLIFNVPIARRDVRRL
jgi:hypothetical protein